MQTAYNVIAYKDKPRLQTAVEMLRTTQEIERRLEDLNYRNKQFTKKKKKKKKRKRKERLHVGKYDFGFI
jgi:hypothetical protein